MRSRLRGRLTRLALPITSGLILVGPALPFCGAAQSGGPPPPSATHDAAAWLVGSPVGLKLDALGDGGLVVVAAKSGDAAARSGLRQGDHVQRIDDQPVTSAEAAAEAIQLAWTAGKSAVDLVVSRAGQDFYVALRLRH